MSGPENETPKPADEPKKSSSTKSSSSSEPAETPSSEGAATAQATAAVTNAVSVVRERLVAGEQMVLTAALSIVVIVYLVFEFLLDFRGVISDFTVIIAVLTVLAIWVHRWGHYDFGNGYRIIVGALGLALALFAVLNFLAWLRAGGGTGGEFLRLIGMIIYWISGLAAGYGAWLVFRLREE